MFFFFVCVFLSELWGCQPLERCVPLLSFFIILVLLLCCSSPCCPSHAIPPQFRFVSLPLSPFAFLCFLHSASIRYFVSFMYLLPSSVAVAVAVPPSFQIPSSSELTSVFAFWFLFPCVAFTTTTLLLSLLCTLQEAAELPRAAQSLCWVKRPWLPLPVCGHEPSTCGPSLLLLPPSCCLAAFVSPRGSAMPDLLPLLIFAAVVSEGLCSAHPLHFEHFSYPSLRLLRHRN